MPKATLEFDLDEEREAFNEALNGQDWKILVQELDELLRGWLKHGHTFQGPYAALDYIRKYITTYELENGLILWD